MKTQFDNELEERLVRYCKIDTQADEKSTTAPSTAIQFDLLNLLVEELKEIGAQDVQLTDYGAVLATIPATIETSAPVIGFLAHVDTAPAFHASGVKPIVHRNYDGGEIVLPDDPTQVLSPKQSPYLANKIGDDIVTASGTTLLGADDKAGVAIIMTMARHLLAHPEIPHGALRIGFTPDEEIGRGVHKNLPADLGAKFAYTLDGADLGEIVYETFSADKATVRIQGVSTHPGDAKDKLVNALHLAAKIIDTLPHVTLTPETTSGRQGFIHIYQMSGTAAEAEPHLPDERHGGGGGDELHPARLRDGESGGAGTADPAGLRHDPGDRAARPHHLYDHGAISQHALLAGKGHAPGGAGARGVPPGGRRTLLDPDSRRHRRFTADRDGRADAEYFHRHEEHSRPTGVQQRAGYGARHRGVHPAGAVVGERSRLSVHSSQTTIDLVQRRQDGYRFQQESQASTWRQERAGFDRYAESAAGASAATSACCTRK